MKWATPDNVTMIVGIITIVLTLIFVIAGRAVSTGHAMVMAAGAVLIVFPSIAGFEWKDGGLKYTRREETSDLADRIKKLADDNSQANAVIKQTAEALKVANDRLTKLEAGQSPRIGGLDNGGQDGGGKQLPTFDWGQYAKPTFYDDLIKKSNEGVKASADSLDSVKTFQKEFEIK